MIRRAYVRVSRLGAAALDRLGVLGWLSRRRSPFGRHVYSLFAIYDVDRMIAVGLPWWTYGAIAEVDDFLSGRRGDVRVFEFGAGASTLWLAERATEVHSVEHDLSFVQILEPRLKRHDNVDLRGVEAGERTDDSTAVSERKGHEQLDFADYVRTIDDVGGLFDLIVVDGRARSACLQAALPHLADDGMVVFDNAGRSRYAAAIAGSGIEVDVKRGWAPSLPYREATALLRKPA
ncbi:MAG TPA: class I SAM-dependent methyltransferase [Acidimicrobiales bacterium]|nr:class I SAM-dependent methyltransferase [Acidimicrobiales bacterium]